VPRIFPDGTGARNPKGFDFYDRMLDTLLDAKIAQSGFGARTWIANAVFHSEPA
jgi:hypothetical protein